MSSIEVSGKETNDEKSSRSSGPTADVEYNRTISQDLRYLDDALTHAIEQLTTFNSETMSDLSLKYEYIRNNEVRFPLPFRNTRVWILSLFMSRVV